MFLNQPAVFICATIGSDFTEWKINGTNLRELSSDDLSRTFGQNVTLTIQGRVEYNESRVQCVAGDLEGNIAFSENVTLTIQGTNGHTVRHVHLTSHIAFS